MEHVTGEAGAPLATAAGQASSLAKASPVSATGGIVRATQDATSPTPLGSNATVRGFWLLNHHDSGGVLWFAKAGATAPVAAGTNALGGIVPGDRVWFGLANTNALQIIASATTTYYSVVVE